MSQLDEFVVDGTRYSWPSDVDVIGGTNLAADIAAGLSSWVGSTKTDDAFAPPLPEVIISPPAAPPAPPVELIPTVSSTLARLFGGALLFFFPTSTGPAEFDEAPTPPSNPPPPPGATDPIEPPNWDDLSAGGDESLLDPVRAPGLPVPPVEMPTGEPFFDVTVPRTVFSPPLVEVPLLPEYFDEFYRPVTDAPGVGPGPAPAPISTPGVDPATPRLLPFPDVRTSPDVDSPVSGAPDLLGSPLPDLVGDPVGDPYLAPGVPDPVGDVPRVVEAPGIPAPGDPFTVPQLDLDPLLTEFSPDAVTPPPETCSCDKKPPKKKPKKSSDRTVCYRGSYRQLKKGISYKRLEEVPCESKAPKEAKSSKSTRKKRKPAQNWKDTVDEVFGRLL